MDIFYSYSLLVSNCTYNENTPLVSVHKTKKIRQYF